MDVFIAGERETTAGLILEPESRERDSGRGGPRIKRGRVKNIANDTSALEAAVYTQIHASERSLTHTHTHRGHRDRSISVTLQCITEAVTFS